MVISRAPFRISFFGGGTDFPSFFEKYGGAVLSTTIDKYCYAIIRKLPRFFDYHTQVKYAKTESVRRTEDLEHPLIRNAMNYTGMHNLSILYDADLPARSGIGSSSSFGAALLQGLYALNGKYIGKEQLAKEVIHVERNLCAEAGGWQDQIAAAYGGLNRIEFDEVGFSVHPVIISAKRKRELEQSLLLFFTGISRNSFEVSKAQAASVEKNTDELLLMKDMVEEAEKILISNTDINEFGKLLDKEWRIKREISEKISSGYIDALYERGLSAGATGGKLLGAGGGGFILFFAEPQNHPAIVREMKDFISVPVAFESEGARVIHYTSELGAEKREVYR